MTNDKKMFRSKNDVDRHASAILSRIRNANERTLRYLNIAKLYVAVKEYETAKHYLAGFLSIQPGHAAAHKLLGQVFEASTDNEKAIESYKRSLQANSTQKDLFLKICELLCKSSVDVEKARYWLEKAEKVFHHHPILYKLKDKVLGCNAHKDPQELEQVYAVELAERPNDLGLRIRLLHLYMMTERCKDAYEHSVQVEAQQPYSHSREWYMCLAEISQAYLDKYLDGCGVDFYIHLLSILDKLVYLSLENGLEQGTAGAASLADCSDALHRFDQAAKNAFQLDGGERKDWLLFTEHMKGQLFLHAAILVMKRCQQYTKSWKESTDDSLACFLVAYSFTPLDKKSVWYARGSDLQKRFYNRCFSAACVRLSQAGHMAEQYSAGHDKKPTQKITQLLRTEQGRDRIFHSVFVHRDHRKKKATSYLGTSQELIDFDVEWPVKQDLAEYDRETSKEKQDSLHHLTWLALHRYTQRSDAQPDLFHSDGFTMFDELLYSTTNLKVVRPESLCKLDTIAFLYATVYTTLGRLEEQKCTIGEDLDRPFLLPAIVSESLCSPQQADWWKAAYKLVNNAAGEDLASLRVTLQRGLEVVRATGIHGLSAQLVVQLARTFQHQASAKINPSTPESQRTQLAARAVHYWKAALNILEKLNQSQVVRLPKHCLFSSHEMSALTGKQVRQLLEQGHYFLACQAMAAGQANSALTILEGLHLPEAAYKQAMILKSMGKDDDVEKEAYLSKALDCLYLALDRIRKDRENPLNTVLALEIEQIASKLQCHKRGNGASSEMDSWLEITSTDVNGQLTSAGVGAGPSNSTPLPYHSSKMTKSTNLSEMFRGSASPSGNREHVEPPSPERLAAQLRAMSYSQDTFVQNITNQYKSLQESSMAIVEELRNQRAIVEKLKSQIEKLELRSAERPHERGRKTLSAPLTRPMDAHQQGRFADYKPASPMATPAHVAERPDQGDSDEEVSSSYNYYYDGDEFEGDYDKYYEERSFEENPAPLPPQYVMGQYPIHAPYPYTQLSGIEGTSTLAYPPQVPGASNMHHHGYPPSVAPVNAIHYQYYPHPSGSSSIIHGGVQPFPYYPAGTTITGALPFGEGTQLPEFKFPPLQLPVSSQLPAASSADPCLLGVDLPVSHLPALPGTQAACMTLGAVQLPKATMPSSQHVASQSFTSAGLSVKSLLSSSAITRSGDGQAHSFQIPLPADYKPPVQATVPLGNTSPTTITSPAARTYRLSTSQSQDGELSDHEPSVDFVPLIPLPAEVEVLTGEENEEIMFSERAKLFRFTEKEWKERGIGIVKVLKSSQKGTARVLMRRDQVLKVCANHNILPGASLSAMAGTGKAWVWYAQDFSEEQPQNEHFCIRFKTPEIALEFKRVFEICAKFTEVKSDKKPTESPKPSLPEDVLPSTGFGYKFKAKVGSWNCEVCYINNSVDKTCCIACMTPKPSLPEDVLPSTGFGDKFKAKVGSWNCEVCYIHNSVDKTCCIACMTPKPGSMPVAGKIAGSIMQGTPIVNPAGAITTTGFSCGSAVSRTASGTVTSGLMFGNVPLGVISAPKPSVLTTSGFMLSTQQASEVSDSKNADVLTPATLPTAVQGFSYHKTQPDTARTGSPGGTSPSVLGEQGGGTNAASDGDKHENDDTNKIFGGFSFSTPPKIQGEVDSPRVKPSAEKSKSDTAPKPSPFAGFMFPMGNDTNANGDNGRQATMNLPAPVLGADTTLDFAALAKLGTDTTDHGFQKSESFAGFPGAGNQLFSPTAADDQHTSDFEPTGDFHPVMPLPALVEVKTGEEDESKQFGVRAKLYRFDLEAKEWKERGIGELKILKHKVHGRCRVIMRREQVHKLCANHYITPEMTLNPVDDSDTKWCWHCIDYSEDKGKKEFYAAKFKTAQHAHEFNDIFYQCQNNLKVATKSVNTNEDEGVLDNETNDPSQPSLAELFKPKPGSWTCTACYINNSADSKRCIACETPRPDAEGLTHQADKLQQPLTDLFKPKPGAWMCDVCSVSNTRAATWCVACEAPRAGGSHEATSEPASDVSSGHVGVDGFTFDVGNSGMSPSTSTPGMPVVNVSGEGVGFTFNKSVAASGFSFVRDVNRPASTSNSALPTFAFGMTEEKNNATSSEFQFNLSDVKFTIGAGDASKDSLDTDKPGHVTYQALNAQTISSTSQKDSVQVSNESSTVFGTTNVSLSAPEFKFSGVQSPSVPASNPESPGSPIKSPGRDDSELYHSENESDHIHFEPLIPLPDKVEVVTGEEEEKLLFSHRAKLFRHVDGEWKERGIGDIKLLLHQQLHTVRVLMRRERILTIACNHYVKADMALLEHDERSWMWCAIDHADNVPRAEKFAVRFKSPQIAMAFSESFEDAKQHIAGEGGKLEIGSRALMTEHNKGGELITKDTSASPDIPVKGLSSSSLSSFSFNLAQTKEVGVASDPLSFGNKFATLPSKTGPSFARSSFGQSITSTQLPSGGTSMEESVSTTRSLFGHPDFTHDQAPASLSAFGGFGVGKPSSFPGFTFGAAEKSFFSDEVGDLEVVYMKKAAEDQVTLAKKFQLPENFYLYEVSPVCSGCRGCDSADLKARRISLSTAQEDDAGCQASRENDPGQSESEGILVRAGKMQMQSDISSTTKGDIVLAEQLTDEVPELGLCGSATSFAELANVADQEPAFVCKRGSDMPFRFAGAGQSVFGSILDTSGEDSGTSVSSSHNIHFESTEHLPDLIELKTGEEDEERIFSNRGKLYRFSTDTGQWKERGVGDMKILQNNDTGRGRLLLRREQIHKLACNQLVVSTMELKPMMSSETAWCWHALDHSESEPSHNKFAIRFKTKEVATEFKEKFEMVRHSLDVSRQPTSLEDLTAPGQAEVSTVIDEKKSAFPPQHCEEHIPEKESAEKVKGLREEAPTETGDDEEEDNDIDEQVLFEKRAKLHYIEAGAYETVGTGTLQVIYDDDVYGARVRMYGDSNQPFVNHVITRENNLRVDEKKHSCEWTATDFATETPVLRTFSVQFSSTQAMEEFIAIFTEGKTWAKDSELSDIMLSAAASPHSAALEVGGAPVYIPPPSMGLPLHLRFHAPGAAGSLIDDSCSHVRTCDPQLSEALEGDDTTTRATGVDEEAQEIP